MISRSFLARSQERAYTSPIWYAPGTGRHARLAAAWTVVATGLAAAAAAQIPPPPDAQRALSDQYEGTSYSPYAGRELPGRQMPSRLLWGDTHLHTAMSMDAGAFGNRLGIEEAYRFARGEEVVSSTGMPVKLSRPLDFLVVADHSDNMGLFPDLLAGKPHVVADPKGKEWYERIQAGEGVAVALELIGLFSQGRFPEQLVYTPDSAPYRSAWQMTIDTAEKYDEPGRFTALIGFEWTSLVRGNNLHRVVGDREHAAAGGLLEAAIALSIVFVAAEVLHGAAGRPGVAARRARGLRRRHRRGLLADRVHAGVLGLSARRRATASGCAGLGAGSSLASRADRACTMSIQEALRRENEMPTITTHDGTQVYYKDWGSKDAQPIVFHHGWPLSSDDWDTQMLHFVDRGYRVIGHDRRGHGRSSQVSDGHDMDHYAADVAAVVEHLDLRNAVHIGHSTGGGEATRYAARHGQRQGRIAKLVLIGAVPPIMVKTPANPGGLPIEVFDGFRRQLAANRAQFYLEIASGPFYGFNRPGAQVSQAVIQNWWRQGMAGGAKAHYDGIKAFSETDFTEDLRMIDVPTLVMHGEDDQIVPIADSALLSAKLLKNSTLKVYEKLPHGLCTTHAEVVNADLLAFIEG